MSLIVAGLDNLGGAFLQPVATNSRLTATRKPKHFTIAAFLADELNSLSACPHDPIDFDRVRRGMPHSINPSLILIHEFLVDIIT